MSRESAGWAGLTASSLPMQRSAGDEMR